METCAMLTDFQILTKQSCNREFRQKKNGSMTLLTLLRWG